jgi:hypothetical protein
VIIGKRREPMDSEIRTGDGLSLLPSSHLSDPFPCNCPGKRAASVALPGERVLNVRVGPPGGAGSLRGGRCVRTISLLRMPKKLLSVYDLLVQATDVLTSIPATDDVTSLESSCIETCLDTLKTGLGARTREGGS